LGQLSQPPVRGTSAESPPTRQTPAGPGTRVEPNAAAQPGTSAGASSEKGSSADAQKGAELYKAQGCAACHKISGQGGVAGPDLSDEANKRRSADWLAAQIRNAKAHDPNSIMPPYPSLSQEQVENLVAYLLSLRAGGEKPAAAGQPAGEKKETPPVAGGVESQQLPASGKQGPPGEAATLIGGVKLGRVLFADYCSSCHGPRGTDNVPNPGSDKGKVPRLNPIDPSLASDDPSVFAANLDRIIQHGSIPRGPRPAIHMPAYGDGKVLTQPQIAAIEAYILDLNGIDRARIVDPGISPIRFFAWAVAAFIAICATAVIVWLVSKRPRKL
jgi:sulfur oxidation c-type cytochrome SoxX